MKNFATLSEAPPEWPAFLCLDGYAWHPKESVRHCHKGLVTCSAETLATVYQGEAVDRLLALRALLVEAQSQTFLLRKVFPTCEQCVTPKRADQIRGIWRRAAMAIHEDAIPYLREAKPGWHLLRNIAGLEPRTRESSWYKRTIEQSIPVHDPNWDRRHPPTNEATRTAQIFWASNLIAAREARVA